MLTRNQRSLIRLIGVMRDGMDAIESTGGGWCFACDTDHRAYSIFAASVGRTAQCPACGEETVIPWIRSLTDERKQQLREISAFIKTV